MLKIIVSQWDKNKDELKRILEQRTDLNNCEYKDLVKLAFEVIYNTGIQDYNKLNLNEITEVDNGDYQGTLLFLIPFNVYQPCEFEYLMTYVGYGSCSGCDTLQAIQSWGGGLPTERQVKDFMQLCKDILTNTVKPFNGGWRESDYFKQIEER